MTHAGLDGVVAATTTLSDVDGEKGELVIAGYQLAELAERATFEETTWLLWRGALPSAAQLESFRATLAAHRALSPTALQLTRECARQPLDPMDALRIVAGTISMASDDPAAIVAQFPTIVAAWARLKQGAE